MVGITRRTWLSTLLAAPVAGGWAAWAERVGAMAQRQKLSPRERVQRNHLPNIELVAHDGRKVRFYDDLVKDRKVVINFMYAECEKICIPVTANLARAQRMLGDRVGHDIFFYSITLKPDQDSPEHLRHYAQMHHVGPGWLFLTGNKRDIEELRRGLGFARNRPDEDADTSNHTGMLRIGIEAEMRWGTCPGLANPEHILRSILWNLDPPVLRAAG
jgi:protein SCO1/2